MAELPEIYLIAQQMKNELVNKTISGVEILQPKCLNLSSEAFTAALSAARIMDVTYRGKWVITETDRGWLLLCLGMGGEILLVTRASLPEKWRVTFDLTDASGTTSCLAINFWWFGYAHYTAQLANHAMTASLGPNAIELNADDFRALLRGRRGQLKSFLLDQSRVAGIGNFYIHDILFQARLHPLRAIQTLGETEITALAEAIQHRLRLSIDKGGFAYEQNLYGQKGSFGMGDLLIGYKVGQPCPQCGAAIQKIKTGSTSGFVCPQCQV
jgi:formamidopyrimidine-DNA glycosylase